MTIQSSSTLQRFEFMILVRVYIVEGDGFGVQFLTQSQHKTHCCSNCLLLNNYNIYSTTRYVRMCSLATRMKARANARDTHTTVCWHIYIYRTFSSCMPRFRNSWPARPRSPTNSSSTQMKDMGGKGDFSYMRVNGTVMTKATLKNHCTMTNACVSFEILRTRQNERAANAAEREERSKEKRL